MRKDENFRGFISVYWAEGGPPALSGRLPLKAWWQGRGECHGQPCLGGRRAAKVAHAVAAGRDPQSPMWRQRDLQVLTAGTA